MTRALEIVLERLPVMLFGMISMYALAQTTQGWEISGTVTTDSGPVKNAFVIITGPESVSPARTDGEGRYSLQGVTPGRYSLRVQKKDNTSEPRSRAVTLNHGLRLRVDFRIPVGAVLAGRVLDQDRQPVSGVVVLAMAKSTRGGRVHLKMSGGDKTNDLGEYRIAHLPDGAYVVAAASSPLKLRKRASTSGTATVKGNPPITFYPGSRALETAAILQVRSGEERPGLDIMLRKEETKCVFFRVNGAFVGAQASSTNILLEEQIGANAPALAQGEITGAGPYEICGLPSGEYRLHLSSATLRPFQVLGYQMALTVVDKQNVDLGSLEPLAPGELRGKVTVKDAGASDSIPAGIRVRALALESTFLNLATQAEAVQPDGSFVLPRVYMGNNAVRVDGLPAGYYVISASQRGKNVLDGGMLPGNGDLQITLGADGAVVSGRVLTADDAVVPDASVVLIPNGSGALQVVQADQKGTYQFPSGVEPAEYRLAAAPNLTEWQRQDPAIVARLAAGGVECKLGPRESRTIDLRVQSSE